MPQTEYPVTSALLCERCRQMTSTLEGLREVASKDGFKHLLGEEMLKSAERGCPLCKFLKNNHQSIPRPNAYIRIFARYPLYLQAHEAENFKIQSESDGHPFEKARLNALRSMWWDDDIDLKKGALAFSVLGFPGILAHSPAQVDDPAAKVVKTGEVTISVTGEEILQELKKLLTHCCEHHASCPKPLEMALPSRVIDVGSGIDSEVIRLHVTQPEEKAQYLALSYRWGGAQAITTTSQTLSQWQLGIALAELPLTIQNAITLTRDLGFRYLWVDALCIIQDYLNDKNAEISRMGTIYKNATLTISAANTKSVRESFLAVRDIPHSCTVPILLPDGGFGKMWILDGYPDWLLSPLDSRAWALQESLLSPRLLWYGPADLNWKCYTVEFKDVYKPNKYTFMYPGFKHKRLPSAVFGFDAPAGTDLHDHQSTIWLEIVYDYSGRDVTLPEDRLPALAGVASELQKIWQDDYLAGMWRSCLVKHLAWGNLAEPVTPTAEDNLASLHLPLAYLSPGWSWSSYKGAVGITEVLDEHAEVVECTVTLVDDSSPFSRVHSGKLVMKAACITEEQRMETNEMDCWFKWDYRHCIQQDEINHSFQYAFLGWEKQGSENEDGVRTDCVALVLVPVGDGTFMRIGMVFGFSTKDWSVEALERQTMTII